MMISSIGTVFTKTPWKYERCHVYALDNNYFIVLSTFAKLLGVQITPQLRSYGQKLEGRTMEHNGRASYFITFTNMKKYLLDKQGWKAQEIINGMQQLCNNQSDPTTPGPEEEEQEEEEVVVEPRKRKRDLHEIIDRGFAKVSRYFDQSVREEAIARYQDSTDFAIRMRELEQNTLAKELPAIFETARNQAIVILKPIVKHELQQKAEKYQLNDLALDMLGRKAQLRHQKNIFTLSNDPEDDPFNALDWVKDMTNKYGIEYLSKFEDEYS